MHNQLDVAQLGDTKKALAVYQNGKYNLLNLPAITAQDGDYELTVTVVPIDVKDPALVYPTPGRPGHVSLHAIALRMLAHAAGVQFGSSRTYYDPDGNPTCSLMARAQVAPNDWRTAPGTYKLDIAARCEELRLAAEGKKNPQARARALQELPALQARTRRFATALAETGAMNRALRALLNVRGSYSKDAMARPFVVARIRYDPQAEVLRKARRIVAEQDIADLWGEGEDLEAVQFAEALIQAAGGPQPPPAVGQDDIPEPKPLEDIDGPLNDWYNDVDISPQVTAGLQQLDLTVQDACKLLAIEDLSRFPGDVSAFWYRLLEAVK